MRKLIITSLLSLSLCFVSFCKSTPSDKERAQKDLYFIALLTFFQNQQSLDYVDCFGWTNGPNPTYFLVPYYYTFALNSGNFQNIIIGDSSMDISTRYANFIDPTKTYSYAVAGNTSCDMRSQFSIGQNALGKYNGAIQAIAQPQFVLIATAGGNDMLQSMPNSLVIKNNKDLVDKARLRFPLAKIVVVGIHPTQVAYGNANKVVTNTAIKDYLTASVSNSCYLDPKSLFSGTGSVEGGAAEASDLLDSIHYNQAISFALKAALQTNCGISL